MQSQRAIEAAFIKQFLRDAYVRACEELLTNGNQEAQARIGTADWIDVLIKANKENIDICVNAVENKYKYNPSLKERVRLVETNCYIMSRIGCTMISAEWLNTCCTTGAERICNYISYAGYLYGKEVVPDPVAILSEIRKEMLLELWAEAKADYLSSRQ